MRYLILLCFLSGCAGGYTVDRKDTDKICKEHTDSTTYYVCREQTSFMFRDVILKICDTKEECNEYCSKKRGDK